MGSSSTTIAVSLTAPRVRNRRSPSRTSAPRRREAAQSGHRSGASVAPWHRARARAGRGSHLASFSAHRRSRQRAGDHTADSYGRPWASKVVASVLGPGGWTRPVRPHEWSIDADEIATPPDRPFPATTASPARPTIPLRRATFPTRKFSSALGHSRRRPRHRDEHMFDLAQEVGLRSRRSHRLGRQQRNRVDERDLEPRYGL
jgi:hypothetical protein